MITVECLANKYNIREIQLLIKNKELEPHITLPPYVDRGYGAHLIKAEACFVHKHALKSSKSDTDQIRLVQRRVLHALHDVFRRHASGVITCNMDGYAIVERERFDRLREHFHSTQEGESQESQESQEESSDIMSITNKFLR